MASDHEAHSGRIRQRTVISLADSSRIGGFLDQKESGGFVVLEAVDNRTGTFTHAFDVQGFRVRFGREPRLAEMGCTLSHMEAMRRFAHQDGADDELMLVAEDDVRFIDDFEDVLKRLVPHVPSAALVVLADPHGPAGRRDRSISSRSEHFVQLSLLAARVSRGRGRAAVTLGRWSAGLAGMSLYLISRGEARRIVAVLDREYGGRPWWVADFHGFYRDHVGVDVLAARPNLISWEGESSVQDHKHVEWRDGEVSRPVRTSCREYFKVYSRRALMSAKSTKFDLQWRLRSIGVRDSRLLSRPSSQSR